MQTTGQRVVRLTMSFALVFMASSIFVKIGKAQNSLPKYTLPNSTLPNTLPDSSPNTLPNNTLPDNTFSPNAFPSNSGQQRGGTNGQPTGQAAGNRLPNQFPTLPEKSNQLPNAPSGVFGSQPPVQDGHSLPPIVPSSSRTTPMESSNSASKGVPFSLPNPLPTNDANRANRSFDPTQQKQPNGQSATPQFSLSDPPSVQPKSNPTTLDAQLNNNQMRSGTYDRFSVQDPDQRNTNTNSNNGYLPGQAMNGNGFQVRSEFNDGKTNQQPKFGNMPATSNILSSMNPNGRVQPVSFDSTPPASAGRTSPARKFLDRLDVQRIEGSLPGEPIALVRLMQSVEPRMRKQAAASYWRCFAAWARLKCVELEYAKLQQLRLPQSQHEQTMLQTAVSLGKTRSDQAKVNLQTAQRELARYVRTQHRDILPMAKDLPLIGAYATRYEKFSSRRSLPQIARQLHLSLPKQKELIDTNALLIQQSELSFNQSQQAYSIGQASLSSVLESVRLLQQSHKQFVDAVVNYNQATADYAFTVASPFQPGQTVAAMLIPLKPRKVEPSQIANSTSVLEGSSVVSMGNPVERTANSNQNGFGQRSGTPVTGQVNPAQWQNNTVNPTRVGQQPPNQAGGGQFGGVRR